MAYIPTNWSNGVTKLNANNMNNMEDELEIVDEAISVSGAFNGLELDVSGTLSLTINAASSINELIVSETKSGSYDSSFVIDIPENYGSFYRKFFFYIVNTTNNHSWIKGVTMEGSASTNNIYTGTDGTPDYISKIGFGNANLINDISDIGCDVFTNDSSDELVWTVYYDKDLGSYGQLVINLASTGGLPHVLNFKAYVFGLV